MPFQTDRDQFRREPQAPLAILCDVHGNAQALHAAANQIQDSHSDVETLVILGDLFTYGCEPRGVIEIILELSQKFAVWLVVGNHDEFYFDCLASSEDATKTLPDWIRETVDWTRNELGDKLEVLNDRRLWHRELVAEDLLLSHANPFDGHDWTYLNDESTRIRAIEALATRDHRVGIFGHTHRRFALQSSDSGKLKSLDDEYLFGNVISLSNGYWVLNPGSVGQPRERVPVASFALLRNQNGELAVDYHAITYDPQLQVDIIRQTKMSEETKEQLVSYLISKQ